MLVSSLLDVVAKHPLTQTTSMEDDTRTLSNGGLSRDVSLAVQFRRSRKALLSQLVYEAEGVLDANSKPNYQSSMPKERACTCRKGEVGHGSAGLSHGKAR